MIYTKKMGQFMDYSNKLMTASRLEISNNQVGVSIEQQTGNKIDILPVELGHRTSVTKGVNINDNYEIQDISLSTDRIDVNVELNDNTHTIPPGNKRNMRLNDQDVRILKKPSELKTIQDSRVPNGEKVVREGPRIETTSVSPKLMINNVGGVEVFNNMDN
jgi:hypothetical protein